MHNNIKAASSSGIVHQCLQQTIAPSGDHWILTDTLIQDQIVMPYESAFSQVLIYQQCSLYNQAVPAQGFPGINSCKNIKSKNSSEYDYPENKAHYES
ncbi:hypothetical protein Tco_0765588 [Tanacetum coccineum]